MPVLCVRRCGAVAKETSLRELMLAGAVALLQWLQLKRAQSLEGGAPAPSVPWWLMAAFAFLKVQRSLWQEFCMVSSFTLTYSGTFTLARTHNK